MDATELFDKVITEGWTEGYIDGCKLKIAKLEKIKQASLKLSVKYPSDTTLILSAHQTDYIINNLTKTIKILNLIEQTFDDDEIMSYCESLTEII